MKLHSTNSTGNDDLVPEAMQKWRECPDEHLAQTFLFPPVERKAGAYPGQITRIGCIDFGTLTQEDANLIKKEGVRLSLCHALVERSESQRFRTSLVPPYVYTMLLEVIYKDKDNQDIIEYYQAGEEVSEGLITGPSEVHWKQASKHLGIKKEVKDQFCHNWCYLPNADVSSMFYSFGPNIDAAAQLFHKNREIIHKLYHKVNSEEELVKSAEFKSLLDLASTPSLFIPVKGLKYPIVGSNLTDLKAIVKEGSHLRVHLGINPSDFAQDKDLFTIIIELDNSPLSTGTMQLDDEDGGSSLFDFVNACPPLCCGGPGQPACP